MENTVPEMCVYNSKMRCITTIYFTGRGFNIFIYPLEEGKGRGKGMGMGKGREKWKGRGVKGKKREGKGEK